LAEKIIDLTDSHSTIIKIPYDEAYAPGFEDMRRRVPSIEKLNAAIGFTPQFSLDQTLNRVINYEKRGLSNISVT
jgi:UDP-glucose 4-epimerase